MRRRARAGIVTLALALTALSSCGASGTSSEDTAPATAGSPGPSPAAKPGRGGVALKRIGNFQTPVYVAGAPGQPKLLFVVEQAGRIQVLRNGRRLGRPFLDISGLVSFEGERGLLSVAFPPDYAQSGLFYVYYTDRQGNIRIDEFRRRSETRAAAGSRRAGDRDPAPENSNHNGGQLAVPRQPPLLRHRRRRLRRRPARTTPRTRRACSASCCASTREASSGGPYTVPPSNPFVGRPGRDEIYSYGLRNPFRFSFDTVTAEAAADRDRRRRPEPLRGGRLH